MTTHKIVPREPTPEMIESGLRAKNAAMWKGRSPFRATTDNLTSVQDAAAIQWKAMYDAAPEPPGMAEIEQALLVAISAAIKVALMVERKDFSQCNANLDAAQGTRESVLSLIRALAQPRVPKLPEESSLANCLGGLEYALGWNACRAEVLRLNGETK